MGGVDWVGGNKWSSFFEEIVELTVFSSGAVVLSDLIGSSWNSDVDFGEFFKSQFFSMTQSLFLLIGLFVEFSFESSEDGVLSFFDSIGLFVSLSDVIISEFINEELCWVSIVWEKFVISVELISHSSFTTVFDEFNWGLAFEGDFEDVSEFEDETLFSLGISVQELFADSWVVSVWLDHSEERVMIVSWGDVSGLVGLDHSWHVEDFRLPIVLPSGNSPEKTLISDSESHLYLSIFNN